jgi:peptidyl-prolyl cis-trans isomerase B (cyclophilin B)
LVRVAQEDDVVPNSQQRRDAARRQLERKLAERELREAANRKRTLILSISSTIALIVAIVLVIALTSGGGKKKTPSAATKPPTPSATPSATASPTSTFAAKKSTRPCGYTTADAAANPALKNVGLPPDPKPTPIKTVTVDFTTNRGLIEVTLDGANAPCNVQAIAYLIHKKFYDKTPCPRIVNSGIFVVQCGSGGTSTAGGPTFTSPDENVATANYSAGAIAMANTGQPHSASSQFFFITKDSNKGLGKSYTVIGHVTKGLAILQQVANGGDDGSSSAGGGAPKLALTFTTVRVVKVSGGGATPGIGPTPTLAATS